MSRALLNWIDSYCEYTAETESAPLFHKWTGMFLIASALRRKVWFNFGRIKVYPNIYVVFVAEPGMARKTQAITFGEEIISKLSGIAIAADVTSPQALLDDVEESVTASQMPDGTVLSHCSLNIFSGEFESFIGDKNNNNRMITMLTDLFDCKQRPYKTRTRHSGSNEIPHPYLNLIAATTPDSLANSLPVSAIGGGLTSRIIFISAEKKHKKIDVPEIDESMQDLKQKLVQDLSIVSRIAGGYDYSPEARKWWRNFYNNFEENDPKRICTDPAFRGWYSRKPLYIIKLAIIIAAATDSPYEIPAEVFQIALQTLEEAEKTMPRTFSAVGRSSLTADVDTVRNIIKNYKFIDEHQILQMVWRDLDARKFDTVANTIVRSGEAKRIFTHEGKKGVWYVWTGDSL